jgi:hypothetical protein
MLHSKGQPLSLLPRLYDLQLLGSQGEIYDMTAFCDDA